MHVQELIANFVIASIIILSVGVVLYAFVTFAAERSLDWLARQRPLARQVIDGCQSLVDRPTFGLLKSVIETGAETVSKLPWTRPSSQSGSERRRHRRYRTGFLGTLHEDPQARAANLCDILDISTSGARIRPVDPMPPASQMTLGLERIGLLPARVVWNHGDEVGLSFEQTPMQIAYMMRGLLPMPISAH